MLETLEIFCHTYSSIKRWVLAFSGGRDSVALLHGLKRILPQPSESLLAVHIHHGLQAKADDFLYWCASCCEGWEIPFQAMRVTVSGTQGTEANARRARYQALSTHIQDPHTCLLTAHHQTDQALTLLLQLGRGAGLFGLAGMPVWKPFAKGWHGRPLLFVAKREIERYTEQEGLVWIEDPSNQDPRYLRNQLRKQVWPVLLASFPAAEETFVRSSRHLQQAYRLCDALAAQDLACVDQILPSPEKKNAPSILLKALQRLSLDRQSNVLRYWLKNLGKQMPNTERLETFLKQIQTIRPDSQPALHWDKLVLEVSRGRLYLYDFLSKRPPFIAQWDLNSALQLPSGLILTKAWLEREGVDIQKLNGPLKVRYREGGERYYSRSLGGFRSLKKWFQEHKIPLYQRKQAELLFSENKLVAVLGFMVSDQFRI